MSPKPANSKSQRKSTVLPLGKVKASTERLEIFFFMVVGVHKIVVKSAGREYQ
jgi:hypothetical protein